MSIETTSADAGSAPGAANAQGLVGEARPIVTVRLQDYHDTGSFKCNRSPRVEGFFANEWQTLSGRNYCRVFILEDDDVKSRIMGYYTLSAAFLEKKHFTNGDERRSPRGFHPPMVRIGFMGRHDDSKAGTGKILIADAANRVDAIQDIGICGVVLEPEGGLQTPLADYYASLGFKKCRECQSMYAFIKDLL